jgi:hypothetical protein
MIKFTVGTSQGTTFSYIEDTKTLKTSSGPMAASTVPVGVYICVRPGPGGMVKVTAKETV